MMRVNDLDLRELAGQPLWHLQMSGVPTLADAILDRVIHNAYRIDLAGESLRKRPSSS